MSDVCDPFAGSGATGVAAWDLDLPCVMIERDPESFANLKRLAKFMSVYGLEVVE
ncbi:hypothetical protein ACFSVK_06190 [Azorhizophilus paspali]|uniref:hypothetical protein n=1 Tax=Azorhizophilus paspali TaxID=69963 RepID=UPI003637B511